VIRTIKTCRYCPHLRCHELKSASFHNESHKEFVSPASYRHQIVNSPKNGRKVVVMFRLRKLFVVPGLVLLATAVGSPATPQERCEASPFGECWRVHARFTVYTGNAQEVLWPVGTHRLLRVVRGDERLLKVLTGGNDDNFVQMADDYEVFGDFEVCPLEKDVPGAMRDVCIKKAENLRRVRRKA
jgi:hypothetical protein